VPCSENGARPSSLWAFWGAMRLQMRETTRTQIGWTVSLIQPAVYMTLSIAGGQHGDPAFVTRALTGSALVGLWSNTVWSAASILRREIWLGTLGVVISRPVDLVVVLMAKATGVTLWSLAVVVAAGAAGVAAAGLPVDLPGFDVLFPAALLAVASAASLGLLLSSLIVLVRGNERLIEALSYPVLILGGLLIPVNLLPSFLRWPSGLVSLHHVVTLLDPEVEAGLRPYVLVGLLTGAYLTVGTFTLRAVLDRGRREGTLDFV
jgi:ABC-2 type transport system permease protein